MVLAHLTLSQGTSKFCLVIMRGGTLIFMTHLASWWAITYNGGTFYNLICISSMHIYIGMHYRYQLLYVLNVISSFCI